MTTVVSTLSDRCRRCYSCVRRCPARAIRVHDGQAQVIEERCVSCGRCLRACARNAKQVLDNLDTVRELLAGGRAIAMIAPTFPAAFPEVRPGQVLAAVRAAGFAGLSEVAFGADLVSRAYARRFLADPDRFTITTTCPAAVTWVRKYASSLVPNLAPLLSPMAALGKALKLRLRPDCQTVFIGPCTAKLSEAQEPEVRPWVDAAITFHDLRRLIDERGIDPGALADDDFDPPRSGLGQVFPLQGGLLRAAGLPTDLLDDRIHTPTTVDGFIDSMERLARRVSDDGGLGDLRARFFDVLYCKGCIDGPILNGEESPLRRKERVLAYFRSRAAHPPDRADQAVALDALSDLDLSRGFTSDEQQGPMPSEEEIQQIMARSGKSRPEDELNCRACGYRSCRDKAIAVYQGLAEEDMCLPGLIERLEAAIARHDRSRAELNEAQAQLIRSERLASMGQLAAGIAHEVNNPLGTILLYAHLLVEGATAQAELRDDAEMVLREARRCKTIVGGLLDFARQSRVTRTRFPLGDLIDEAVRIVAAQASAHDPARQIVFRREVEPDLPDACLDRDQMMQVLINLLRNAADALADGGTITAGVRTQGDEFSLRVSDTGSGIRPEHMDKLFSPFFTTRGGRGNGLGLPICYGIVKMHRGTITARNNTDGPGATFEVRLPITPEDGEQSAMGGMGGMASMGAAEAAS